MYGWFKKGILKRWKEVVEQDISDRELKSTDAQDSILWKCGCKNWLTWTAGTNLPYYRKVKEKKPLSAL